MTPLRQLKIFITTLATIFAFVSCSTPSLSEIENSLVPPVGTSKTDVENYFGYSLDTSDTNGNPARKITYYDLFYPVSLEVIYTDGKVSEAGIHHRTNIADWSSCSALEVNKSEHLNPTWTNKWLRDGYIHFIEGRRSMSMDDTQPTWWAPQN